MTYNRSWLLLPALLIAFAIGGYAWWFMQRTQPAPAPVAEPAKAAPQVGAADAPAVPADARAIAHPIEHVPDSAPGAADVASRPLPGLDASDGPFTAGLSGLAGSNALSEALVPDGIIRRIVATVDNLPQPLVGSRIMAVRPVAGAFAVGSDSGETVIAAANDARYAPYVRLLDGIDAQRAVAMYVRFYPLFQRAYVELGYPNGYFNDRLVAAIDDMLRAPAVDGPVRLTQAKVLYTFADPDLEARSAGQKVLIRMGARNAEIVRKKLGEVRQLLAR